MSYIDRYGPDALNAPASTIRDVTVEVGMVLEDVTSGYVGEVMKVGKVAGQWQMELEDAQMRRRGFPIGRGFWLEGEAVNLIPPLPKKLVASRGPKITASGSFHVEHEARVAKASRIWVEGKHDAELISKIWGSDLAYEGIMIEELFGADHLADVLAVFGPSDSRRAGIMLDHLVAGSKEACIAAEVATMEGVLVLGHPYVDIWQAIKPGVVGLKEWPHVPRGEDIKKGTLARMGWPHATAEDIGLGWARILRAVRDYRDLEPAFLGRMEELIDFVTAASPTPHRAG
ncbi:DUF3097 domain-containing protein [Trueperella bernardiae]|uniref:DUF3097 family protein n=1 Tax=Trueperella bernardiae TaxID=59561 RepID=A0AAW6ZJT5_9ACTO|nr:MULTISPECIES: DUF3097 family protein [Trueperella]MDK8602067.1 DUF3097 family protein [Trueperella bernardiae]OCW60126.1 hypothetical protein AKG36_06480 [Trueperella bernardiae]OFS65358.1 hypothetical protein HMPREF3174_08560 [Trueperella sp. HMSC08H06]PKZ88666.1 DUF3097 domain-containing protein [Trueperella bernardiae]